MALESLSAIDVQLKKRHDLIPNVVAVAQIHMTHEKALLETLVALRQKVAVSYDGTKADTVVAHFDAEAALGRTFGALMARVDSHPTLRAEETLARVQETLEEVEGHIAAARRWYNASARTLKDKVEVFPGLLLARWMGIEALPFYEASDDWGKPSS
ncbi:MAG: LemA family protein [Rhodospirillum sp.]|nr:LemA family protein [Rhodospirillum sp.]MCF8491993.1 LemA family protein [Rhodospirillum sp.]MCF8503267.1 LemA family protein [Rhodospirillum sp.]